MNLNVVTVIGANGTMGKNVSAIFASFGGAKVYMVCREEVAAHKAKEIAKMSVKAETIADNMIPKTYEDLEECISQSDLVFESVFEDISIKKDIYNKIAKYIKKDTIIATGTSGISINKLSKCFDESIRQNYLGVHMFNPPYNMTLCEVIPSDVTNPELVAEVKRYLEEVLLRNVVEVKDEAAFMGNRIGFMFINEALQYAEKYKDKGGIDYIDSILGPFTGRAMPPIVTSDFVGLDVHKAIVDNVFENTADYARESFSLPEYTNKLIKENRLGRKAGEGFYKTVTDADGKKTVYVYDIATGEYRLREKHLFSFAKEMIKEFKNGNYKRAFECLAEDNSTEANICLSFLIRYVLYCITITRTIGENIHSADDVMAYGFNWVPALAVIDAFGGVERFKQLSLDTLDDEFLARVDVAKILADVPSSKHDYRPFFKARG